MATSEEVNIRITATDELSPVLRGINEEFGTLLETKYDWRPTVAAFAAGFLGVIAASILGGIA